MKAALVYTSTTPELIELVEKEVTKNIGTDAEIISLQDPSILAEVREAGYVTKTAAARLIGMYMEAVAQGADAILNICSSVPILYRQQQPILVFRLSALMRKCAGKQLVLEKE